MPDPVVVPEVAPVVVEREVQTRFLVGRFFTDYVETFAGLLTAQIGVTFVAPQTFDGWRALSLQLLAPALAAFISAGRRAWPTIRARLRGEESPRDIA